MACRAEGTDLLIVATGSPKGSGKSVLLVSPEYEGVTESWFSPEFWGDRARPVTSGGRGGAWFVDAGPSAVVLRHYKRGGLIARLSQNRYLFIGQHRVRSIAEFRLLSELCHYGLPVPRPVAAWFRRTGLFYEAAIIIERIEDAVALGAVWRKLPPEMWIRIGQVIRKFHDTNVYHADLNCFNILLKLDLVYLIDFDKGKRLKSGRLCEGRKRANLDRLHRSLVHELQGRGDEELLRSSWASLEQGYFRSVGC